MRSKKPFLLKSIFCFLLASMLVGATFSFAGPKADLTRKERRAQQFAKPSMLEAMTKFFALRDRFPYPMASAVMDYEIPMGYEWGFEAVTQDELGILFDFIKSKPRSEEMFKLSLNEVKIRFNIFSNPKQYYSSSSNVHGDSKQKYLQWLVNDFVFFSAVLNSLFTNYLVHSLERSIPDKNRIHAGLGWDPNIMMKIIGPLSIYQKIVNNLFLFFRENNIISDENSGVIFKSEDPNGYLIYLGYAKKRFGFLTFPVLKKKVQESKPVYDRQKLILDVELWLGGESPFILVQDGQLIKDSGFFVETQFLNKENKAMISIMFYDGQSFTVDRTPLGEDVLTLVFPDQRIQSHFGNGMIYLDQSNKRKIELTLAMAKIIGPAIYEPGSHFIPVIENPEKLDTVLLLAAVDALAAQIEGVPLLGDGGLAVGSEGTKGQAAYIVDQEELIALKDELLAQVKELDTNGEAQAEYQAYQEAVRRQQAEVTAEVVEDAKAGAAGSAAGVTHKASQNAKKKQKKKLQQKLANRAMPANPAAAEVGAAGAERRVDQDLEAKAAAIAKDHRIETTMIGYRHAIQRIQKIFRDPRLAGHRELVMQRIRGSHINYTAETGKTVGVARSSQRGKMLPSRVYNAVMLQLSTLLLQNAQNSKTPALSGAAGAAGTAAGK